MTQPPYRPINYPPLVTMGVAEGFPRVQGRCPACGLTSLFLGAGGHVTCSLLGCPDPCAADDLLAGKQSPLTAPVSDEQAHVV